MDIQVLCLSDKQNLMIMIYWDVNLRDMVEEEGEDETRV